MQNNATETFIKNVNSYIEHYNIRKSYISNKSGVDITKLNKHSLTEQNIKDISNALGPNTQFFLEKKFTLPQHEYTSGLDETQNKKVQSIIKLLQNIDEIIGVKERFLNISR